MAIVPTKNISPFDKHVTGVFGEFKTKYSFELNYLLTTVKSNDLSTINTARELLPFDSIDFEELVQRDIDEERVQNIKNEYLASTDFRVRFFPPLLVTLMAVDENGRPVGQYKTVNSRIEKKEGWDNFVKVWDGDRLELELPLSQSDTGHHIFNEGKPLYFHNHAATINYNSKKIRLIVIDGQHRLQALKALLKDKEKGGAEILANVEIPVCVFFSPNAMTTTVEDNVRDMRELFVRVNHTARTVSGHFIVLLDDKSISSYCVRDFAKKLKKNAPPDAGLFILEWNQRSDKKADQRTKSYSITTISILASALSEHIFDDAGTTDLILNLASREAELNTGPGAVARSNISDSNFAQSQITILKEQIERHITPSLEILFLAPTPYAKMHGVFREALKKLNEKVTNNIKGAQTFRDEVLLNFVNDTSSYESSVQDVESEFNDQCKRSISEDDDIFFRNVFHQALIRVWGELCKKVSPQYGVSPEIVAKALIAGLEPVVFNASKKFFSREKSKHTQQSIYNQKKIIVNATAKSQLTLLLQTALLCPTSRGALIKTLALPAEKNKEVETWLRQLAVSSAANYLATFKANYDSFLRKNWNFSSDVSELERAELEKVLAADGEDAKDRFQERIARIADDKRTDAAKSIARHVDMDWAEFKSELNKTPDESD